MVVCLGGGGWGAIFGWKAGGLAFPQAQATVGWSAGALPTPQGTRCCLGLGDSGVLAGEGGSPAGALPNPAACSPGILLLRDGKSRLGLQLIPPLREEEGLKDSFLHTPPPSGAEPSLAVGGAGGPRTGL